MRQATACLLLLALVPARPSPSACAPPEAVEINRLTEYLEQVVSSDLDVYRAVRDSVGLRQLAHVRVRLERGETRCRAGVAALNRLSRTPGQARRIWLFDLRVGFAIQEPGIAPPPGQSVPLELFDSHWVYKGTLMEQ